MQPSVQYAGFWQRFAALILDELVLLVPNLFTWFLACNFLLVAIGIDTTLKRYLFTLLAIFSWVPSILIRWIYGAGMESSTRQATFGKIAMGIIVTDINGNRLSFGRATGRQFGQILSGLVIGIGYLIAAFTAKKQGLHDLLAKTLVVVKQPSTAMPPSMMPPAGTGPSH